MNDVAAKYRTLAFIREPKQDMARRVARRGFDRKLAGDVIAVINQHGLARFHNRKNAVLIRRMTRVAGHRRIFRMSQ